MLLSYTGEEGVPCQIAPPLLGPKGKLTMKKLLLAVVALCAMSILPAFAEHEWGIDKSTGTWGLTNDLWRIDGSLNNGSLTINAAAPLPGNPDVTTLDISGLYGFVWKVGAPYYDFICWNGSFGDIKTLIISDQTYTKFVCRKAQMPNLTEVKTHNADYPHRFSIKTTQQGMMNSTNLEGEYEITDMTDLSTDIYAGTKVSKLKISGAYSTVGNSSFFNCPNLTDVDLETTAKPITFGSYLFGYYGNNTPTTDYPLRSVTLNGASITRSPLVTKVPFNMFAWCKQYAGGVDLPNCTYVDQYAFSRAESIPFVNLMAVTVLNQYCFENCKGLTRVVFGAEGFTDPIGTDILTSIGTATAATSVDVIWNCKTKPQVNGPFYRDLDKSKKRVCNYVRKEANWLVENMSTRPYVKHDGTEWCVYDWNNQTVRQPLIAMDTVFKVNLRLDNNIVMTTLMPGVSGENPTWTIPASWFLGSGKTFGEGTVKDADGNVIDGATAIPDGTGLNLTITLPASRVASVEDTTQDDEVFVDMVAQESKDPQITVSIVDEDENVIVADSFEATVGTSVTKDYSATILGDDEYYYNNILSQTVNPKTALTASLDLAGKLSLVNIAKDATVSIKIDRAARPAQLAYWNVDIANYTMSDGVWTFRCDFTDDKAVIADAIEYKGADKDVAEVDFTKPIGTDGSSAYQVTTLDWGATINGTAVAITANNSCGKTVVINGGAGTAATLVGALKIPDTVESIAGWGYCANLTMNPASLVQIDKFGKYALARTSIAGALVLSDEFPVEVGDYAFERCSPLTSLKIPSLGSTIGESAFYACTGMKTIELDGVTSIKWAAFSRDSAAWIEKVVLSPALTNLGVNAFYKSIKSGCVFDAVSPKDMPEAKSGDGVIAANVFQDIGANSIVIPFKGTCTIGAGAFHFSMTTNFIFWGKAPENWAHEAGAEFNENVSKIFRSQFNGNVKTDRMFTVSLEMDQAGWESVATKLKKDCTDGEWTALNPPATAFGWVMVAEKTDGTNQKRVWLCEGKSPWERGGLMIMVR